MKLNILIGGQAGQGINAISQIVSSVLTRQGYFTFNYRDYPSLIRGGHNFNILSLSDTPLGSYESRLDGVVALDKKTLSLHKKDLKKSGFTIDFEPWKDLGININIALAGALIKILGLDKNILTEEIEKIFGGGERIGIAEEGYQSQQEKFNLEKQNNKINIMSGSKAIAQGAINSGLDLYLAYPMTPATGVLHQLAARQVESGFMVFQPENEIAVVNAALGASFSGAKTMIGTSGGGFDLMTEGLSLQGMSELPLVVCLVSRPGPATGLPTYTRQDDLEVALRGGHGEFPRAVIAPGDPLEAIEKTNEAFYMAHKFNALAIILADKHLAESEFSFSEKIRSPLKIKIRRVVPGEAIIKTSGYEHDSKGNTIEDAPTAKKNADARIKRYHALKKECEKFEMIKIYGNPKSKNLLIGWGSTKTAILDAIKGEDCKFLQVLYMKPMSDEIEKEISRAEKVVVVEQNISGQLGRLLREKTGFKIKERILKYDGRPFASDQLKKEIKKRLK